MEPKIIAQEENTRSLFEWFKELEKNGDRK